MNKVNFDHDQEKLFDAMGITPERVKGLLHDTNVSLWELQHPDRNGFSHLDIIEAHVKHAKNEQELAIQAFIAGRYVQENYEGVNYAEEEEE